MFPPALTIARFTLLEGLRARFFRIAALLFLVAFVASLFAGELAITESARIRATLLAALLRPATVFLLGLYIISSMAREFNDKGTELILALDLPRASYVVGKLCGFFLLGLLLAAGAGLLLAVLAPGWSAAIWAVSLSLELLLIAALSVFCAVTFSQVLPAASFVLGFYLLARSIGTIQLLGASPLLEANSMANKVMIYAVDGISLMLPHLDKFTQSAWLAGYIDGWQVLPGILAQALLYAVLLASAAMFDFYRKRF